ncbi:MAG: TlpA disulfide reductase family protein [Amaricoccus sp.]
MPRLSLALALLYGALLAAATPAAALTPAEIEALKGGDMRKLVVVDPPVPASELGFADVRGNPVTLADSNGKVRLVNFWATWCAPCRREMPSLDALARDRNGPGFAVIPIATGRNSLDAIAAFTAEAGIADLPTYLDVKGAVATDMDVPGLPVSVLLDRNGNEVARLMGGADWNSPDALKVIDALVAAP